MEAVVAKTPVGQTGEVGRLDRPAERTGIPEAGVVYEDDQNVGSARRRHWVSDQVPVRLRPVQCLPHRPREGWPANREPTAIDSLMVTFLLFRHHSRSHRHGHEPAWADLVRALPDSEAE